MALTADRNRQRRGISKISSIPMLTATEIFKGAIVQVSAAGYAQNAIAGAGLSVLGVATEHVNNTGASGALNIRVEYDCEFLFTASSITQAMLGTLMLIIDNDTVDETSASSSSVGRLTQFISATQGWVYVPGPTATP